MNANKAQPLSLSSAGPASLWPSVSNFFLPLFTREGAVAAVFYFLDSGGGQHPEVVSFAQAQWLNETATKHNPLGA